MTERERLAELIAEARLKAKGTIGSMNNYNEWIADYLLERGVIAPPCKVGDTVYRFQKYFNDAALQSEVKIKPCRIASAGSECVASDDFVWMRFDEFGYSVFLTREEAEAALAERRKS